MVSRIARYEEHVSRDTLSKHTLTSDVVRAKGEEDPCYISLDYHISILIGLAVTLVTGGLTEGIEQVQNALRDKYLDRLFIQGEVNKSQGRVLLDLRRIILRLTELHDQIDHIAANDLLKNQKNSKPTTMAIRWEGKYDTYY